MVPEKDCSFIVGPIPLGTGPPQGDGWGTSGVGWTGRTTVQRRVRRAGTNVTFQPHVADTWTYTINEDEFLVFQSFNKFYIE